MRVRTGDSQIFVYDRRAGQPVVDVGIVVLHPDFQIDFAFIAESRDRLAGLGVHRQQKPIVGPEQNARRIVSIARPIGHAARWPADVLVGEDPDRLAGLGIERHQALMRGDHVHNAIHHQRCRLSRPVGVRRGCGARVEDPRLGELGRVAGIDLRQPGVAPVAGVTAIYRQSFWPRAEAASAAPHQTIPSMRTNRLLSRRIFSISNRVKPLDSVREPAQLIS